MVKLIPTTNIICLGVCFQNGGITYFSLLGLPGVGADTQVPYCFGFSSNAATVNTVPPTVTAIPDSFLLFVRKL